MFRCYHCGKVTNPKEPATIIVLEYRTREDGSKEILKEAKVCQRCKSILGIGKEFIEVKKYQGNYEHKQRNKKKYHKLKDKWKSKKSFSASLLKLCKNYKGKK